MSDQEETLSQPKTNPHISLAEQSRISIGCSSVQGKGNSFLLPWVKLHHHQWEYWICVTWRAGVRIWHKCWILVLLPLTYSPHMGPSQNASFLPFPCPPKPCVIVTWLAQSYFCGGPTASLLFWWYKSVL